MSSSDQPRTLASLKKRRGVVRASVTKLGTKVSELERKLLDPTTLGHAQRSGSKLESLDAEFKVQHYSVIDLTKEEDMDGEQDILDQHDDIVAELGVRIQRLISSCSSHSTDPTTPRNLLSRKLERIESELATINKSLESLTKGTDDTCRIQLYQEQVSDLRRDLADIRDSLLATGVDDSDKLMGVRADMEKGIFDCSLRIKKLLTPDKIPTTSSTTTDSTGVRLPKLDVPKFNGDMLEWQTFWEQFRVSVHDRSHLSDAEKLAYLRQALKDGTAKSTVEGLSHSGAQYAEAIDCLTTRFDRPRLIHQTHVRKIVEAPSLKDGSGKELRKFHDTMLQHIRALKAMGNEPPGPFLTSLLELKLDENTTFEWHKHTQDSKETPEYQKLLDFVNLRAQASEASTSDSGKRMLKNETRFVRKNQPVKHVNAFAADVSATQCVVCGDKHPLYACSRFKALPHEQKLSVLREHHICMNCLGADHYIKQCKSNSRCKRCQRPHHTLLHRETSDPQPAAALQPATMSQASGGGENTVSSHAATGLKTSTLMMTCRIIVSGPNGATLEARALLDSASSASFVSERLAQTLHLRRANHSATISGIAGLSHKSPIQTITSFAISAVKSPNSKIEVTALIVPRLTTDLPHHPISYSLAWNHLSDVDLADPHFGQPGKIDVLLGVDIFAQVLRDGRRTGPSGSPVAFETEFGWVLAGEVDSSAVPHSHITSHHVMVEGGDDILRKFWEVEQQPFSESTLSPQEERIVQHFKLNHFRSDDGRFVVPLPRKSDIKPLGESRSQAVRRFLSLERSLHSKRCFPEVDAVVREYLELNHAEPVPDQDFNKPVSEVYYLPIHVVRKETSSTTKVRAVFDASAKSSSGLSLNETFIVGPTVHPPLIDVLLRFRLHRVALTTDVSKMYRAVGLVNSDKDLHRFVWRSDPGEPLRDFRMTRVTFGVSASSFAANMSLLQNAEEHSLEFPLAVNAVRQSFYVDDGLTGSDSVDEAIALHRELQELFSRGKFLLRKWNSNSQEVLEDIPPDLREQQIVSTLPSVEEYSKTLGLEWNTQLDIFRLTVSDLPPLEGLTKRALVSDIAKIFDALGWFTPTTVKMKILLQRVWEAKINWDDVVPTPIQDAWYQWRRELPALSNIQIPRCYFPQGFHTAVVQLHGFCDASEDAYAGVVYIRLMDAHDNVHISLVVSKTKVAPIKRLTIPRLELCGAHVLAKLLHHVREVLSVPLHNVFGWTDSSIVLSWMNGNPRRFKTYVGNRISCIMDLIPPERWRHVRGIENPADCSSRGIFPTELLHHDLWWSGPPWLRLPSTEWPSQSVSLPTESEEEKRELCMLTIVRRRNPIIPYDRFSSFTRLKRVTAWVFRFVNNCKKKEDKVTSCLTVNELISAESYWISLAQQDHFPSEIRELEVKGMISTTSSLLTLCPQLDPNKVLRVGGRQHNSKMRFSRIHPIILPKKHPITRLIVSSEHIRLLHAGPTLMMSSLSQRFHIVGGRQLVRLVSRECIICRRDSAKPKPQLFGQLPMERITPGLVFDRVGVDYAGPVRIKHGPVRKPIVVKAYIGVFVSLAVKAVHLEVVSDLTTDAFIAALRRFVARRGKPSLIWSDHGSNFVGADRELQEMFKFLKQKQTEAVVSDFCSTQHITWKFIPEHAPHFGGLWEAAVKSMKRHLRRVVSEVKLTFEELSTVLAQIEACMNSRPLAPLPLEEDGLEPLTPGHFLIGRALESLPDPSMSYRSTSLLRRWDLCQNLTRHFWSRWSKEYLITFQRLTKWKLPSRNMAVGDVVVLREDGLVPSKWQLARVTEIHTGRDGIVRVATIKTTTGTYRRPVTKLVLLLPMSD